MDRLGRLVLLAAGLGLVAGALLVVGVAAQSVPEDADPLDAVAPLNDAVTLPIEAPSEIIQAMIADAASSLAVDPATVQVTRAEQRTWPDASLGCPQSDRLYPQVITPGWLLELLVGDAVLEYHTAEFNARGGLQFVLCGQQSTSG
jgi:hypothetical protein